MDSVINQTLKDIEIICVNDGSTDSTLQILDEYAQKDPRIRVINQENHGVSVARNSGLEIANGEYIMFLDSDDWYDLELCKIISEKIDETNADIICYGYNAIKNNEIIYSNLKEIKNLCKKRVSLENIVKNQVFVWDKAFRREFIASLGVKFIKGLKCAEDLVFCLTTFYNNPHYVYIDKPLYYYQKYREGNATSNNFNAIKNDLNSFKSLAESEIFKKQPMNLKKLTINHFISGSIGYYRTFQGSQYEDVVLNDITDFLRYIELQIPKYQCYLLKNYRKLKKILWKSQKHWYFNIFNIETNERTKTITFMGKNITVNRTHKINSFSKAKI